MAAKQPPKQTAAAASAEVGDAKSQAASASTATPVTSITIAVPATAASGSSGASAAVPLASASATSNTSTGTAAKPTTTTSSTTAAASTAAAAAIAAKQETPLPGRATYPIVWISADREKEFEDVSRGVRVDAKGPQVIWYDVDAMAQTFNGAVQTVDPRIWQLLRDETCTAGHLKPDPTAPDPVCSICLEHLRVGDALKRIPVCRHLFHARCVRPWFSQTGGRRSCPYCRQQLNVPAQPVVLTQEPGFKI